MVSDTYEPTKKGKATSTAELNKIAYSLKTREDYKRLHQSKDSIKKLQKTPRIMANGNPLVPAMDWTEDAELHKRYVEWREEVELELGSSLSNRANSVKFNYVLRWAGKPARDYLKSLPESEFKYAGASADAILTALEKKTKPKSNEIAAFTKLCSLKQGDMPLSEFIREAKRLAELCNYPNDQDRFIRDTIVSGVYSLKSLPKMHQCQRLKSTRLHGHLTSRRCHQNAGTGMQTRVCQLHPECTDYDPSP